jgi:prephenate dehydratase
MMKLMKWLRTKRSEREHGKTRFVVFGSDIAANGKNNNISSNTTQIQFYTTLKRDKIVWSLMNQFSWSKRMT